METQRKLLRRREVLNICGISDATRHRLETAGRFPSRVRISAGAVGWWSDEIAGFVNSRQADVIDRSHLNTPGVIEKRREAIRQRRKKVQAAT
jgi:prophage regulatory protein